MDKFQWWTELTHGGIFISNPVLNESFEERQVETWHWKYKRLRDNYNSFLSKESVYRRGSHPVHAWITNLFEDFLGHDSNHWLKGQNIPQRFAISICMPRCMDNPPKRGMSISLATIKIGT